MANVTFKVEGLQELGRAMRDLSSDMQKKVLRSAVAAGANVIRDLARANAPELTGALKKSIATRRDINASRTPGVEFRAVGVFSETGYKYANTRFNRRKGRVGKVYNVEPPTFYWRFQEFGSRHQKKKPFLRPALDEGKEAAADAMAARLKKRIDEVKAK